MAMPMPLALSLEMMAHKNPSATKTAVIKMPITKSIIAFAPVTKSKIGTPAPTMNANASEKNKPKKRPVHILILDEPTAGLDPLAAEILKDKIVSEHQKGKLVFITSHLLSELDDLVTHVVMMQEGEIRFHMPTDALKASTNTSSLAKAITHVLKQDHVQ